MRYDNEELFEHDFNCDDIFNQPVAASYNELSVTFLTELSKILLKNASARQFPDLITFAYFCRKSNLVQFQRTHLDKSFEVNRFGWGVCLHIAPANIPMNFAFSFIMGLLSGNKNIVRLPTKQFEQIDIFLSALSHLMDEKRFKSLMTKNVFIRTKRDSKKLIKMVSKVDALVVWGGNNTVNNFRNYAKKPSCIEVYFPDRVSSLLVNCDDLVNKSAPEMEKVCIDFFNDTYLVDQNACSSASMICWYSKYNNFNQAKELFSDNLNSYLTEHYSLATTALIEKRLDVLKHCEMVGESINIDMQSDKLWYVESNYYKHIKPKLGTFISKELSDLSLLTTLFRDNEQTLTYLGFDSKDILALFCDKAPCLIDRVVPVGKALDIGLIWDGKNMIQTLSKYVDVA